MRKIILSLSLLFAFAFLINMQANAQKIGYAQVDSVAAIMPEYKVASSSLEDFGKQMKKRLDAQVQKIQAREAELKRTVTNQEQQEAAQVEMASMYQEYQNTQKDVDELYKKKEQDLFFPIYEKIRKAIEEVGKENNYVLIFSELDGTRTAYILYSAEGTNVTDLVKAKLGL